jgi:hypothetical protein
MFAGMDLVKKGLLGAIVAVVASLSSRRRGFNYGRLQPAASQARVLRTPSRVCLCISLDTGLSSQLPGVPDVGLSPT